MNEKNALLTLNAIKGLGNRRICSLIDCLGSAKAVLSLSRSQLVALGILPEKVIDNIMTFPIECFLKREYELINRHNVKILSFEDEEYPEKLKEIPDAPVVLYVKGDLNCGSGLSIGIVGSRRSSLYGLSMAKKFAFELAEKGITVVSGMARGVDTQAHWGALKTGGMTVAVLGSGLARIYPPENKKLYEHIAKDGAVVSEFPMETEPFPKHFPRRNRIISGMALGIVVIEAALKSGALITSDYALEQGRDVFAVPGKIDQVTAMGCNNLIKQGAKLVMSAEDILEEFQSDIKFYLSKKCPVEFEGSEMSDDEQMVYHQIKEEPLNIDQIASKCSIAISKAMGILLQLELKHCIKQMPGKLFARIGEI